MSSGTRTKVGFLFLSISNLRVNEDNRLVPSNIDFLILLVYLSTYFLCTLLCNYETCYYLYFDYFHICRSKFVDFFYGHIILQIFSCRYVFTIVSYLIGVFIFATIVGQVGNVITNRNANRLEFERLLDGAKTYMRHHKVSELQ